MIATNKKFARIAVTALSGLAVILIAGCNVGPNYQPPATMPSTTWKPNDHLPATRPSKLIEGQPLVEQWWTTLQDPTLNRLMRKAQETNLDLAIAKARMREARAQRSFTGAAEMPKVEAGGSYSINRHFGPLDQAEPGDYNFYQAGFDAHWEIDIFGGTRRAVEAATADVEASIEESRSVRITLLAEVARTYVDLRATQKRIEIAQRNLTLQQHTYAITKERLAAGVVSDLDVSRAAALVANTRALLPSLQDQADQNMRRLSVLLGQEPQSLLKELSSFAPIPAPPESIAVGMPAELVRQRPDVRAAERRVASATARIGVATAELYPRFMLNGAIGQFDVNTMSHFANFDNRYFGFGPAIRWDVFDAGRTKARIAGQQAATDRMIAEYQKTVLIALAEAHNAWAAFHAEQNRRSALVDAVVADQHSVETASQLYKQGVAEFLTVLDAERSLATAEDNLAQSDKALTTDLIALYKALGGGKAEATTQPTIENGVKK